MSTTTISLAPALSMPIDVATEAIAVLGRRGKGKTNTAVVLVEELVGAGVPVCVVDTVGVWWGVRSSASGKRPGLPVVVFGGLHGDVPLEEASGKVIAAVVVDRRISAVIDTSLLSKRAARRFLTDFVTEVYHRNREPMHVVFDEADELAPQRPGPEGARLLGAMEDFVRRGRARGLGCTLVTQRPAVLHKDVLTQIEVLVAHGMTGPRDVAAIDEWVRLHADEDEAREVKRSLAGLPTGTAWVWSPSWLGILQQVQVRQRRTFDSSATPKVGTVKVAPTSRARVDLDQLGEEIAATVSRAQAEDPKALRARIAELERRPAALATPPEPKVVEIPVLDDGDRAALDDANRALAGVRDQLMSLLGVVDGAIEASRAVAVKAAAGTPPATGAARRAPSTARATAPRTHPAATAQPHAPATTPPPTSLGKAERAILSVLATYGTRSHTQVALLTGYSSKGGGFSNALSRLRSSGRIEGGRTGMTITDVGRADLGAFDPLPSGPALIEHWLGQLGKAERAILQVLVDAWPQSLSNDEIAARTDYAAGGGGFSNALSRLRTLELISGTRHANVAADELGSAR